MRSRHKHRAPANTTQMEQTSDNLQTDKLDFWSTSKTLVFKSKRCLKVTTGPLIGTGHPLFRIKLAEQVQKLFL